MSCKGTIAIAIDEGLKQVRVSAAFNSFVVSPSAYASQSTSVGSIRESCIVVVHLMQTCVYYLNNLLLSAGDLPC